MKTPELNRTFLARDVYPRWKRLVANAKAAITIYTPFFDRVLLSLLESNHEIKNVQVTIVTDLNPLTLLELPNQLRTMKKAISRGFTFLSLPGLHAKVLLVDDKFACTGSQNFTLRG